MIGPPARSRSCLTGEAWSALAHLVDTGATVKYAAIAASLLLALPGSASAQPGAAPVVPPSDVADDPPGQPPTPAPAPAPVMWQAPDSEVTPMAPPPRPHGSWRSGSIALLLSISGTAISWGAMAGAADLPTPIGVLGVVGSAVAPSFGNWYAGKFFTRGLVVRLGGMAAFAAGISLLEPIDFGWDHNESPEADSSNENVGGLLLVAGLLGFVIGTIDDIASGPGYVQKRNREHGYVFGLAPVVTQHSTGFALGGRF